MRDPLVGRTLGGKYTLESLIGTGAMGAVYRARHVALDAVVALKVMHDDIAVDNTFAERFHREARAASRLNHPNVIRVIDFGIDPGGNLYIAMEYVEGIDLYNVIRRDTPLPESRIVDLLAQALSGIAAAHDMGVIHRDLKPENIMVSTRVGDDGALYDLVKVCDFGIAQITEPTRPSMTEVAQRTLTVRGVLLGTPQYMSPEQARGEVIDARSDVYAIGVILYQLLTGQLPFEGPTPIDTVLKHISEEPVPPSALAPSAPPWLEAVCMKALAKRREARWSSAREMRAALRSEPMSTPRGFAGLPTVSAPGIPSPMPPTSLGDAASTLGAPQAMDAEVAALKARSPSRATILGATIAGALLLAAAVFVAGKPESPSTSPPPTPPLLTGRTEAPSHEEPDPRPSAAPAPPVASTALDVDRARTRAVKGTAGTRRAVAKGAETPSRAVETAERERAETPALPPSASSPQADTVDESPAPKQVSSTPSGPSSIPATPKAVESPPQTPAAPFEVRPGSAKVRWRVAQVGGGATSGDVGRAVSRAAGRWDGCYERGLRSRGRRIEGQGTLRLSCDDQGRVVTASLSGIAMSDVAVCVRSAVTGITIPNADTGEAWATIAMTMTVTE